MKKTFLVSFLVLSVIYLLFGRAKTSLAAFPDSTLFGAESASSEDLPTSQNHISTLAKASAVTKFQSLATSISRLISSRKPSVKPIAAGLEDKIIGEGNWSQGCLTMGNIAGSCTSDFIDYLGSSDKQIKFTGNKNSRRSATVVLSDLKPGVKYRLSFLLAVEDRETYIDNRIVSANLADQVRAGQYDVKFRETKAGTGHDVWRNSLQRHVGSGSPYVRHANRDYFLNELEFTSADTSGNKLEIQVGLDRLLGKIYLNNLQIQELKSFAAAIDLKQPVISSEMKIIGMDLSHTLKKIFTSTASFTIDNRYLRSSKSGEVAALDFGANSLRDLRSQTGDGYVLLENKDFIINISADSTVTLVAKNNRSFSLSGLKPSYFFQQNDVIFIRDASGEINGNPYGQGLVFMPILGDGDYRYADNLPKDLVRSTGNIIKNINWNVRYSAKAGDAFLLSVFPPKAADISSSCQMAATTIGGSVQRFTADELKYTALDFTKRGKIAIMWMGNYGYVLPENRRFEAPEIAGIYESEGGETPMMDPDGPMELNPLKMNDLVAQINQLHSLGRQVVFYFTPNYFYSKDQDLFINNITSIFTDLARRGATVDGVYLDGLYQSSPFHNLLFVRKLRVALGDKIYIQHSGGNMLFYDETTRSNNPTTYRLPFLDAYADLIWTGESQRLQNYDQSTGQYSDMSLAEISDLFANNFSGKNLSNTPTMLLLEDRRLDPSSTDEFAIGSPKWQIDKQLSFGGLARVNLTSNPYIATAINRETGKSTTFDANYYFNNSHIKNGCQTVSLKGPDIQSFDKLRYTFDDQISRGISQYIRIARDSSSNNLTPAYFQGRLVTYSPPTLLDIDSRKVARFDGTTRLFGYYGDTLSGALDFVSGFEITTIAKKESDVSGRQVIYVQNGELKFGFENNKLFAEFKISKNGSLETINLLGNSIVNNDWHTLKLSYCNNTVRLIMDDHIEKESNLTGPIILTSTDNNGRSFGIGALAANSITQQLVQPFVGMIDEISIR